MTYDWTDLQDLDDRSGFENLVIIVSVVHSPPWCFSVGVSFGMVQPITCMSDINL